MSEKKDSIESLPESVQKNIRDLERYVDQLLELFKHPIYAPDKKSKDEKKK